MTSVPRVVVVRGTSVTQFLLQLCQEHGAASAEAFVLHDASGSLVPLAAVSPNINAPSLLLVSCAVPVAEPKAEDAHAESTVELAHVSDYSADDVFLWLHSIGVNDMRTCVPGWELVQAIDSNTLGSVLGLSNEGMAKIYDTLHHDRSRQDQDQAGHKHMVCVRTLNGANVWKGCVGTFQDALKYSVREIGKDPQNLTLYELLDASENRVLSGKVFQDCDVIIQMRPDTGIMLKVDVARETSVRLPARGNDGLKKTEKKVSSSAHPQTCPKTRTLASVTSALDRNPRIFGSFVAVCAAPEGDICALLARYAKARLAKLVELRRGGNLQALLRARTLCKAARLDIRRFIFVTACDYGVGGLLLQRLDKTFLTALRENLKLDPLKNPANVRRFRVLSDCLLILRQSLNRTFKAQIQPGNNVTDAENTRCLFFQMLLDHFQPATRSFLQLFPPRIFARRRRDGPVILQRFVVLTALAHMEQEITTALLRSALASDRPSCTCT